MKSLLYKIRCLKNINFKTIFKIVNNINKKTNKSKLVLFFDIIICANKYGAGYYDYQEFEFYNLNKEERKTYLTRVKNNNIVKKYNNKEKTYLFDNKYEFNKIFDEYLKRDWLYLDDNLEQFIKFCKNKKEIIVKPVDGCGGVGVELIDLKNQNLEKLYNKLLKNNQKIIEEKIIQNKLLSKLNKSSVNTLRIVSFFDGKETHILNVVLKIGNGGVTDNFSSGSMYTFVKNGKVIVPAIDRNDNIFKIHPISKENIVGYEIPNYEKCIELVKKCSKKIPDIKYIGWDVAVTENDAVLIEGNCYPGIYQIKPSFLEKKEGLVKIYEEALKIKIDKL